MAIGETVITIIGNLTSDPEIRTTSQGAQVASFTIANTPRNFNKQTGQYEDGSTLFMRCSAWNEFGQHCARSLAKGMRVIAQGTKAAAVVLKACRNVMDTKNKQEHIDKWGGIHAITEAVYDCADLAQRILDAGLAMENMCAKPATSRQMILIDDLRRSLDMDDGDVEATVDPDTGEID